MNENWPCSIANGEPSIADKHDESTSANEKKHLCFDFAPGLAESSPPNTINSFSFAFANIWLLISEREHLTERFSQSTST